MLLPPSPGPRGAPALPKRSLCSAWSRRHLLGAATPQLLSHPAVHREPPKPPLNPPSPRPSPQTLSLSLPTPFIAFFGQNNCFEPLGVSWMETGVFSPKSPGSARRVLPARLPPAPAVPELEKPPTAKPAPSARPQAQGSRPPHVSSRRIFGKSEFHPFFPTKSHSGGAVNSAQSSAWLRSCRIKRQIPSWQHRDKKHHGEHKLVGLGYPKSSWSLVP